jgi:hypothetical protein
MWSLCSPKYKKYVLRCAQKDIFVTWLTRPIRKGLF